MTSEKKQGIEAWVVRLALVAILGLQGVQAPSILGRSADLAEMRKDVAYLRERVDRIATLQTASDGRYGALLEKYYEIRAALQSMTPEAAKHVERIEKMMDDLTERVRALEQK